MQSIFFYFFSSISLFSAILVILSKNTVNSVLFLILTFVSTACLWLLLEAEFLAVILILVYVGAVIVLFLFVVMMIDQEFELKDIVISKYSPIIMLTSLSMLVILFGEMNPHTYGADLLIPEIKGDTGNVKMLGLLLYHKHLFAFELAGLLLLVGMVAAIAVSFRGKQDRLNQDIFEQINVTSTDRLKLIKENNSNIE